jgi:DNA polymerase III subunit delta
MTGAFARTSRLRREWSTVSPRIGYVSDEGSGVVLLWGEDPFLLREAALDLLGGLQPVEVDGRQWQGGETADLVTPSLFGERRALLVTGCRRLPPAALDELKTYLGSPSPDVQLILVAEVSERGNAPAALAKLVKPVGEVRQITVGRKDLAGWLAARALRHGVDLAPDAARALIDTIGEAPAILDAALQQIRVAYAGQRIDRPKVQEQFRGLGDEQIWDLCDRAFGRDSPGAIRSLRALLAGRHDPLVILGGLASRLRDLIRVKALPDRMPPADLARAAGLRFEWQGRRYREQARSFSMDELLRLHAALVQADRDLKSGAAGDVLMPALVSTVAAGRDS